MRSPQPTPQQGAKAIFQVVSGNFLEMYDFMVFGLYAGAIAQAYFPAQSPAAGLMLSFATFGAGFLMRPLGALLLGAYIDRHGRRRGLLLSLGLMGIGIVLITLTPGYAQLGLAAPLLVLGGRLLQGFSAGAEVGGVSVYLAEIAPPGRRGFYVSWQSASQQLAVLAAAGLGLLLQRQLPAALLQAWGWRLPFAAGCLVLPLLLVLRRRMGETADFVRRGPPPSPAVLRQALSRHARRILSGVGMVAMTTVAFYLLTAYMPTYGRRVLHLSDHQSLLITACIALSNFALLPLMGRLSDWTGRRPLLLAGAGTTLLLAWPLLHWVTLAPSYGRLLLAGELLAVCYSAYNGALLVALVEWMPAEVRTTGFALAYSLATAIFGGFTPLICTLLIQLTGAASAPALWLTAAAGGALLAGLAMPTAKPGQG